jgi:hypothetical protein
LGSGWGGAPPAARVGAPGRRRPARPRGASQHPRRTRLRPIYRGDLQSAPHARSLPQHRQPTRPPPPGRPKLGPPRPYVGIHAYFAYPCTHFGRGLHWGPSNRRRPGGLLKKLLGESRACRVRRRTKKWGGDERRGRPFARPCPGAAAAAAAGKRTDDGCTGAPAPGASAVPCLASGHDWLRMGRRDPLDLAHRLVNRSTQCASILRDGHVRDQHACAF